MTDSKQTLREELENFVYETAYKRASESDHAWWLIEFTESACESVVLNNPLLDEAMRAMQRAREYNMTGNSADVDHELSETLARIREAMKVKA